MPHGVADPGVPLRAIAEVIGRHIDLPVVAISPEDAGEHFGWLAGFLGADVPATSTLTRELVGWQPMHRAHRRSRPGPLLPIGPNVGEVTASSGACDRTRDSG
jgi:hypothetical protein